jgi:hypothetical protein
LRRLVHAVQKTLLAITEEDLKQALKNAMDKGGSLMLLSGKYSPEEYRLEVLDMLNKYFPRFKGGPLDPKEFMGELSRSIKEFLGKWCRRRTYFERCERGGRCNYSALYECSVPDLGDFYVRVRRGYEKWIEASYEAIVPIREKSEAEFLFDADLYEYLRIRKRKFL